VCVVGVLSVGVCSYKGWKGEEGAWSMRFEQNEEGVS